MFTSIKRNEKGFSHMDTILGVFILSLSLPVLLSVVRDFNIKSNSLEVTEKANVFANTVMNYVCGYNFDERFGTLGAPWSYPLGQDSGDYDDIDDFIGMDWSIIPGLSEGGYTATSNIFYIDPSVDLMTSQSYSTNFKRIVVSIDHAQLENPITITTILTPHDF